MAHIGCYGCVYGVGSSIVCVAQQADERNPTRGEAAMGAEGDGGDYAGPEGDLRDPSSVHVS
jgi:hypothetical protein